MLATISTKSNNKLRNKLIRKPFLVIFILHVIMRNVELQAHPLLITQNEDEQGQYFQGDLIFSPKSLSGRLDPMFRWLNRTIHYEFEPGYSTEIVKTFLLATKHISERTCILFKKRANDSKLRDDDYLYVISGSGCYSYVGRQGGKQVISLPASCNRVGTFVHELLHAVGFHHEQSRTNRDDYVKILWDNIQPGKENQFRKYDSATVSSFGVPYDYDSILHYSNGAYSKSPGKLATIEPLQSGKNIGQRKSMSQGDIEKVNRMYECE